LAFRTPHFPTFVPRNPEFVIPFMLIKCKAIVIRTIDYSETSVVLKCYTDEYGVQSYIVNGVRSKKGSIKPSHLLPLSLLELEAYHQQNKNLQRIKELKCLPQLKTVHFDMVKSAVGMFIAEVMNKTLREENHSDLPLFSYLYNTIQVLDLETERVSNFPVYFLLQLTRYLGFHPKGIYAEHTNGFDTKEGMFEAYDPRNPFQLNPELSACLSELLQCSAGEFSKISVNYEQRTLLLEHIIDYYREHVSGFTDMKSHKVLAEVLA
jgi:DNA repair protein RecO (recombination protein O)